MSPDGHVISLNHKTTNKTEIQLVLISMKTKSLIYALVGLSLAAGWSILQAAPPLAGTPIGNQARATYTDESGEEREAFSNTVITRVASIYGLDLEQDNSRISVAGSEVTFPHKVTNLGNDEDTFTLDLSNIDGFLPGSIRIYADLDRDGRPDDLANPMWNGGPWPVTPPVAAGDEFYFVIVGRIPPTASVGTTGGLTVTATSVGDNTLNESNADSFTVTNNAVMQVSKAISVPSGPPGFTPITYTLTYTNTGNGTAHDFTVSDIIPDGLTYVPGSARWSVSGTNALDDDPGGDPAGIEYDFDDTVANTATYVISQVAPGDSGFVTFQVSVNADTLPGIINNVANYKFDTLDMNGDPAGSHGPYPTNIVPFLVTQVAGVTLDPPPAPLPPAPGGSTVEWTNVLTNTGNGVDTFDIIIDSHDFPPGTTFQIYQQDGQTPMTDSNGNNIPDTGPVQPGATYNVVLKAILPTNYSGDNGGAGFTVTKVARSTTDPTVEDDADDELEEITGASVDLTADVIVSDPLVAANGDGVFSDLAAANAANGGTPIRTNTANPGTTTIFTLVVNNTGPRSDTFNLWGAIDPLGTIAPADMPPGWTIVFRNAGGSVISSTGTIPAGGNQVVTAEVFIPPTTKPLDFPVFFRVTSPVSGALDNLKDSIQVNTVRTINLQTDNVGQTFPGGSVDYEHVLTNNGNVTEGNAGGDSAINFTLSDTLAGIGFASVVYYDVNGNGVLDSDDVLITGPLSTVKADGLEPGESIRLFVKVFAPLGVPDTTVNATTITATTTGDINTIIPPPAVANVDTTTVLRGDLVVVKRQALDDNQDGTADYAFVSTQLSAPPGHVIIYQITVTNSGSAPADSITVYDTIPSNTTYFAVGAQGEAVITGGSKLDPGDPDPNVVVSGPANGGTSPSFEFYVGALGPLESAIIYFGVKIDE